MYRDRRQQGEFNAHHEFARQEWRRSTDLEHQMVTPERARQAPGDADAQHGIRERATRR